MSRETAITEFLSDQKVDSDLAKDCYWKLVDQYNDCATKVTRWLIFGITAVVLFELLNRKLINSASFSFVAINRLSFLPYVLPPFVALSILNVLALIVEANAYDDTAKELARQAFPALATSELSELFTSHSGVFSAEIPKAFVSRRGHSALGVFVTFQGLAALPLYLTFQAYAYYELFAHFHSSDIATYISLFATIGLSAFIVPFVRAFLDTP